jgi:hypothetical protein
VQIASAPVCFNVVAISLARLGLCSMISALCFLSSWHLEELGHRVRPVMDLNVLEKAGRVRRSSVMR